MIKRKSKGIALIAAVMTLLFMLSAVCVYADAFATANIDVRCKIADNIPKGHTFTYELRANAEGNPMPEGSLYGVKTVKMKKSGRVNFGSIEFDHPEVYYYTMRETTSEWGNFKPDPTEYTVILIANNDGQVQTVIQNNKGEKPDRAEFKNTYNTPHDDDDEDEDEERSGSSAQTGDTFRYILIGFAAGMSAMFLVITVYKRMNASGKEKVREFR